MSFNWTRAKWTKTIVRPKPMHIADFLFSEKTSPRKNRVCRAKQGNAQTNLNETQIHDITQRRQTAHAHYWHGTTKIKSLQNQNARSKLHCSFHKPKTNPRCALHAIACLQKQIQPLQAKPNPKLKNTRNKQINLKIYTQLWFVQRQSLLLWADPTPNLKKCTT